MLRKKCSTRDPTRVGAGLVVGLYRYLTSALALPTRLLAYIAGFGGGKERGILLLEDATRDPRTRADAKAALMLIYSREGRHSDVVTLAREMRTEFPRNRLFLLEEGAAAIRAGRPAEAEAALTQGLMELDRDTRLKVPGERAYWLYKRGLARVILRNLEGARSRSRDGPAVAADGLGERPNPPGARQGCGSARPSSGRGHRVPCGAEACVTRTATRSARPKRPGGSDIPSENRTVRRLELHRLSNGFPQKVDLDRRHLLRPLRHVFDGGRRRGHLLRREPHRHEIVDDHGCKPRVRRHQSDVQGTEAAVRDRLRTSARKPRARSPRFRRRPSSRATSGFRRGIRTRSGS